MKKQEREFLQGLVNQITDNRKIADDAFHFLQQKNKEVTGKTWCSAETNFKDLLKAGYDFTYKYELYVRAQGRIDTIITLGSGLAELGFWKN